jgi:hypothetical protein
MMLLTLAVALVLIAGCGGPYKSEPAALPHLVLEPIRPHAQPLTPQPQRGDPRHIPGGW